MRAQRTLMREMIPQLRTGSFIILSWLMPDLGLAQTLTWHEAVRIAATRQPALLAAESSLQSSHEQTLATQGAFWPKVFGGAGYSLTEGSDQGNYSVSVTMSQNLFNGLADQAKIQQAEASEDLARVNLRNVKAQLSNHLLTSFENLVAAKKSLLLAREIRTRRDVNLRMVELRFRGGHENKGSLLLYRAYLKDAKYSETQNRHLVSIARTQLGAALGLDDQKGLDIVGAVPTHDPDEGVFRDPDFRMLAARTPSYQKAHFLEQSAMAAITSARSSYFPTLDVSATTGNSGEWFPKTQHWSLGVNLAIPIFNGGKDYHGVEAAIASHTATERTLKDSLLQARDAIQEAYVAYLESIEKLEVDQSYLKAAETRTEIARANYRNGRLSFQDWDLAETDLINREKNVLQSEQNRVNAEAAYLQTLGEGVFQ